MEVSEDDFNQELNNDQRAGRVRPKQREVLTAALAEEFEIPEEYVGQEVTVFRTHTGEVVYVSTDG